MFSPLVLLTLLAAFFGFRTLRRFAASPPRPVFSEHRIPPERLAEGLVHALVADGAYLRADTRIEQATRAATTILRAGACGRLVLCPVLGPDPEADSFRLQELAAHPRVSRPLTFVVIGGGRDFGRHAARVTSPWRTIHIDDEGRVRQFRGRFETAPRLVVENALDRMADEMRSGSFRSLDFEVAQSLISDEPQKFPAAERPFRGVVTSALSVAILACFAVEVAISRDALSGDGATLSVVYRMGAIQQAAIMDGEWLRLIGAPFLHFGLLHLGMNGWAQWALGTPIEFLLGPWRFFILWLGSALGASLTSLVFNESSVAAGASGAIFGLLGAFTTFVFFRKDVLPQPVPRSLRNGVLATLLLNLMISFIPGIDMAAHAGGFITGGLLALGLARSRSEVMRPPARVFRLRLAVFAVALLGVGVASVQNRADLTVKPPGIGSEYRIGELVLPIPRDYSVTASKTGGGTTGVTTVEADQGPATPFIVTYKVSEPQADRQAARDLLEKLRPDPVPVKDSDWIALSQMGVQNMRAIEIIVVAPASCRAAAETLVSELAQRIR